VLALLQAESGADEVERILDGSALSAVNWSEVVQTAAGHGVQTRGMRAELEALNVAILPFTAEDAEAAAALWPATREHGLSLGDRACLALAGRLGAPAVTADRAWTEVDVGVEVRLIR